MAHKIFANNAIFLLQHAAIEKLQFHVWNLLKIARLLAFVEKNDNIRMVLTQIMCFLRHDTTLSIPADASAT